MSDSKELMLEIITGRMLQGHDHKLSLPKELGSLVWTGWKQRWDSVVPCAQIVWQAPPVNNVRPRYSYYVDIPSMQHGRFENGQALNISWTQDVSHYMDEHTSAEEITAWVKEGLSLLIDDVLRDHPEMFPLHTPSP